MGLSHHAYLISGERGGTSAADFLSESGISVPEGASVTVRIFRTLSIDDARELFLAHLRKTSEESPVVYLIEFAFMTREAQNALLKMLEEPSPHTYFIIATPHPELLLPTLRSRLALMQEAMKRGRDVRKEAVRFLNGTIPERLEMITPFLPNAKDDIPADRSGAENLLRGLIVLLHQKALNDNVQMPSLIGQLDKLHGYITDPSSSVKLILEYVAHSVPST